jgi:hypothetical protein
MGWAFKFEFYPERKRGLKSKNIKAQPMCKFAQLYACHELFLKRHERNIYALSLTCGILKQMMIFQLYLKKYIIMKIE